MIAENLSTLKIHKLTQEQYDREREAGRLDENALYLTPDRSFVVDDALSNISTNPVQNQVIYEALNSKANSNHSHSAYALTSDVSDLQEKVGDFTVIDQIQSAIKINTYNDPSQFGCTFASTLTEVCNAIPNNSIFICGAESFTDASWNLPSIYGTILAFKQASARNIFRFYGKHAVIGNYQMDFGSGNVPTGEWIPDLSSVLSSSMYGTKLPGEDGEPYTHVKGRLFFLKASE